MAPAGMMPSQAPGAYLTKAYSPNVVEWVFCEVRRPLNQTLTTTSSFGGCGALRGERRMPSLRKTQKIGGKEVREMEKTEIGGLSLEELEAQHVELVADRIEMRRFRRRRTNRGGSGFVQDCDQASLLSGIVVINIGGGSATCLFQ